MYNLCTMYTHTGCLKKNWVLPNWAFGDPAANWEEILMIFKENLQMLNLVRLSFFWHPVQCCKACSSVELSQLLWVVTTRSKLLDITIACGKAPLILYFQGRLGLQIPLPVHTNTIALQAQIQYTADECERWHCLVWQSKAGLRARIDCGENSLLPGGI